MERSFGHGPGLYGQLDLLSRRDDWKHRDPDYLGTRWIGFSAVNAPVRLPDKRGVRLRQPDPEQLLVPHCAERDLLWNRVPAQSQLRWPPVSDPEDRLPQYYRR